MSSGIFRPSVSRIFLASGLAVFSVCLVILAWEWLVETGMAYEWHWNRAWRQFGHFSSQGFTPGPLLKGIWLTVGIACLGLCLAIIFGLAGCLFRLSPWPLWVGVAWLYVVLWRNTPLLLQLFFAYFLIAPLLDLSPFWTATWTLALFEGAYLAEIFRAGVLSIHKNQWEAALSLGLSVAESFWLVILPQASRNALPSLTNQAIGLLKDTSLVSAIAVADLTMQSQAIVAETFLAFEVWLLAGGIYLALSLCIAMPAVILEDRIPWQR